MRKISIEYDVYTYEELNDTAKNEVKEWLLKGRFPEEFTSIYVNDLKYLFPNSDLRLQYSLGYCQGDGLNIYGTLDVRDFLHALTDQVYAGNQFSDFWNVLTEKELKTLKAYAEICEEIELPENRRYCYCIASQAEFASDMVFALNEAWYRRINENVILKAEKLMHKMFTFLSGQYEEFGYKYFYEIDEEEAKEECSANDFEFLEDGTFFDAAY